MRFRSRIFLALLIAARLTGQTETGTISGIVTDASKSLVSGAQITLENVQRKTRQVQTTSASGSYQFTFLQPGEYSLTTEKTGFVRAAVGSITLEVNQAVRVDVSLEIGAVSDKVSVTADASLLQFDNTAIGGAIEEKKIEDLPGRNLITLIALAPGAAQLSLQGFGSNTLTSYQPSRGGVSSNINIGGYRQTGNAYILDGVSDTDWNIDTIVIQPSAESLEELRVQTSTNSAPFGQVPGGTVNMVTRGGTNQLHLEAYDYLRNQVLDARPYNFASTRQAKPPLRQNQFGLGAGAPILKNKLFVFGHYEQLIKRSSIQAVATIPTALARTGDLSQYGRTIYNPLSDPGNRSPFPGNAIPSSMLDPVALKELSFMPVPASSATSNNYPSTRGNDSENGQGNLRVDYQITQRDTLTASYHVSDENSNTDGNYGTITGTITQVNANTFDLGYTRIFTPSLINNVKLGYNRLRAIAGVYSADTRNIVGELGITGINEDPANWGFPNFALSSVQLVQDGSNSPTNQRDNNYQILDNASAQIGRHTLQFGAEFRRIELNYRQANPSRGAFQYTGGFTAGPNYSQPQTNSGLDFADFLLGYPTQATRVDGVPQGYLRSYYTAGFVGDSYRVARNLTLTMGLRYEFASPPSEINHNYYNLDFSTVPNPPVLVQVGVTKSSLPQSGIQANGKNFAPRLGLAWQPLPKTVIRAAYGIYYVQEIGAVYYDLVRNGVTTETNSSPLATPILTSRDAFTNPQFGAPSYYYIDPKSATPYMQQWNFGVQRELPGSVVFEAVYAGMKGTKLFRYRQFNSEFQTETGADLAPRPGALQANRTWPSLGQISAIETSASSIYHSLMVRIDKRFSGGVSFLNNFTWSHSIDDSDVPVQDYYENTGAQDERNLRAERGNSAFDVRKRLSTAVVLELPFGKGKRFLSRGILGYVAGPWQVSTILTAQDGAPVNIVRFSTLAIDGIQQRPNVVPGVPLVLPASQRTSSLQYYNPAAVSVPGPYDLGDMGRNAGTQPGILNVDMAFFRSIKLGEARELILRSDITNTFNIVNLGGPTNDPTSLTFGKLTGSGPMRTITLSAKFRF